MTEIARMNNDAVMQTVMGPDELAEQSPVKIKDLYKVLQELMEKAPQYGDMEISLMCGPNWDEIPLRSALFTPEYGQLMLIGVPHPEGQDNLDIHDRLDSVIDAEVIEAAAKEVKKAPAPKEEFNPNEAEEP
jgi:hypothetical protein